MKLFIRSFLVLLGVLVFSLSSLAFGDKAPDWLRQASGVTTPSYDKKVPAVVLSSRQNVTFGQNGKLVTVKKEAIKILTKEGKASAIARVFYLVSSGKIRNIKAWLIRGGKTKSYGKNETLDIISDPDDIYNEYRIKLIDASRDAEIGSVFGYTITSEEEPLYFQEKWFAQSNLPSINSQYTLNLPVGWKATSETFNHARISPNVSGNSYTWSVRNLPFVKSEPMSPSVVNMVPWLAVNYAPEDPSQANNKVFNNWTDISKWTSALYDPQVIINDEIAAKAKELTANARNEFEKIYAIGKYVQNLQYISIDIDVGHGNGYRPRPSDLVMSRGYGDCKDKATLMRAMLKVLKIKAYPVAIFSGDPTFVQAKWASPGQFNHCIIAVSVSDETKSPTIINHKNLGRLLIFDATDDLTPVGDLPDYLQGSLALIMAGENGDLTRMPVTPPGSNTLERNVDIKMAENGSVIGTIREVTRGQSSKYERALFRKVSKSDYRKIVERWLTSGATAAKLMKFSPTDNPTNASFDLNIEFSAPTYGQLMQNRLLIFKPAIVSRSRSIYLTEKERVHPIRLESSSFTEKAVFELPNGFRVDEVPDEVNLRTSFGGYTTKYEVRDGKLIFKRTMTTKRSILPTKQYGSVRSFYKKILDAEQSPVVLLRK